MVWWLFIEEALPQTVAPAALRCAGRLSWVSKAVRFLLVGLWDLLVYLPQRHLLKNRSPKWHQQTSTCKMFGNLQLVTSLPVGGLLAPVGIPVVLPWVLSSIICFIFRGAENAWHIQPWCTRSGKCCRMMRFLTLRKTLQLTLH